MNKNAANFIATLFLAVLLSIVLPWWAVMLAALISALLIPLKKATVFFIPFLAIFLFWGVYSFILSSGNDFTLARKISELLQMGGNPYALIILTGTLGGLAAGISGILGNQVQAFVKSK
jgi:hypothetical protein